MKAQSINNTKPLPKGQTTLTDMFGMSTKKWTKVKIVLY